MAWLESHGEDDRKFRRVPPWTQTLREGRIDFDVLPPFRDWPLWAKNDATLSSRKRNEHLNNAQRFKLWHFFVRNGVEPYLAAGAVVNVTNTDYEARRQLRYLASTADKQLEKYKDARVWDCIKRRPVDLNGNP